MDSWVHTLHIFECYVSTRRNWMCSVIIPYIKTKSHAPHFLVCPKARPQMPLLLQPCVWVVQIPQESPGLMWSVLQAAQEWSVWLSSSWPSLYLVMLHSVAGSAGDQFCTSTNIILAHTKILENSEPLCIFNTQSSRVDWSHDEP